MLATLTFSHLLVFAIGLIAGFAAGWYVFRKRNLDKV